MTHYTLSQMEADKALRTGLTITTLIRHDMLMNAVLKNGLEDANLELLDRYHNFNLSTLILAIMGFTEEQVHRKIGPFYRDRIYDICNNLEKHLQNDFGDASLKLYFELKGLLKSRF